MAIFMQATASIDWSAVVDECESVEESAKRFQEMIIQLLDSYFPLRVIRERSNNRIWMKPSMKILFNRRDRAYAEKKCVENTNAFSLSFKIFKETGGI